MAELLGRDLALPALGANGDVGVSSLAPYLRWPITAWSAATKMVSGALVTLTNRKAPLAWP